MLNLARLRGIEASWPMFMRQKIDPDLQVQDGDRTIPVVLRRHPKARRLTLRIDPKGDGAILTAPPNLGIRRITRFLEEHSDWVCESVGKLPPRSVFADGESLSVLGENLVIRHDPDLRGPCKTDNDTLIVGGDEPHLQRRIRDFLKRRARDEITEQVSALCKANGLKAGRITMRDQSSRWGSCAANGNLSFNWRLVCAPSEVLTYVVAHEVAHLRHMDHSPAFWRFVGDLYPGWKPAKNWLSHNGASLHRIG